MRICILKALATSLALTIALELDFGMILGVRGPQDMALVIFVNLLTNPAVVFLYYMSLLYMGQNQAAVIAALEIGAAAAEGLCYRAASRRICRPWLFSARVSLFPFTAGAAITSLAGGQSGKADARGGDGRQKQEADAKGGNKRWDQRMNWRGQRVGGDQDEKRF